jgi:acetyltransferase-like isoleucine patch superfamily enzyme
MILLAPYIHPTAEISAQAQIGAGTRIWAQAQVREFAVIGDRCNIGKGVYVDTHVRIGSNVKIQNNVSLFEGVTIDDGVFIGPHVCFTNDMFPRAINLDGTVKGPQDWEITATTVGYGASLGAGTVVRCGVAIGRFALVGAGSVVTRDVAPHALVMGNPARPRGYVCECAYQLERVREEDGHLIGYCPRCERDYDITP